MCMYSSVFICTEYVRIVQNITQYIIVHDAVIIDLHIYSVPYRDRCQPKSKGIELLMSY